MSNDHAAAATPKPVAVPNEVKPSGRADRAKVNREFVREFVDANTSIAVRVQRTQAFRPYYSIVIGRFVSHENGESFVPFLPVRTDCKLAKVESITNHSKLVAALVQEATEWIQERCQEREDEIIEQQMQREKRDIDRDKPGTKPGLKTLSKIDRATKNYAG